MCNGCASPQSPIATTMAPACSRVGRALQHMHANPCNPCNYDPSAQQAASAAEKLDGRFNVGKIRFNNLTGEGALGTHRQPGYYKWQSLLAVMLATTGQVDNSTAVHAQQRISGARGVGTHMVRLMSHSGCGEIRKCKAICAWAQLLVAIATAHSTASCSPMPPSGQGLPGAAATCACLCSSSRTAACLSRSMHMRAASLHLRPMQIL